MSYEFEQTDGNFAESIAIHWGPKEEQKWLVSKSAVPVYIFRHLSEFDGQPPFTAADRAYSTLWYGNQHPDLILSSEAMVKRMVRRLKEDHRRPVMYGCSFGFHFQDAIWSYPDGNGFEIEDGWVFMLNTSNPTNFLLNGCYRPVEGS